MGLYLEHAKTLRSADTAKFHALRIGQWIDGYRASETEQAVAEMVSDMTGDYAPATINRSLGTLSKGLRLAWKLKMIPTNYGAMIERLPENNRRDVVLSLRDVQALADAASETVRAAIWIALYTGCRRGELCAIQKEDIGEDSIHIRAANTKTQRARAIPIVAPLRPWLEYLPLAISVEGLKTGFRRAADKAKLSHATFHDLRRSCASMMIEAGVDLYVVSKLLGHSSVAVTQARYAWMQTKQIAEGMKKAFG
jgi:integrase